MIALEGVWKTYDTLVAVHDVGFKLGEGETLGLIGPNGAGKTTLLRMLSTLAKPDSGSIEINGFNALTHPREIRRTLAFMPAEFGCPKDLNMREYMDYFACLAGLSGAPRTKAIEEALELTDLIDRQEQMVQGLSTGNRQRLLLAKTLLNNPRLLILDEPSSGLDPRARVEVREILAELASMGKTIVISSHILSDLESICSHIAIMEAGKMVTKGDVAGLKDHYRMIRVLVDISRTNDATAAITGLG
ncbi:MAG: ABC transporter ATP-binding protein, partial [Verrucomicrobiota bacterium]